jgi:hypothetical protein
MGCSEQSVKLIALELSLGGEEKELTIKIISTDLLNAVKKAYKLYKCVRSLISIGT